jgi:hypothetical protein
MSVIRSLRRPPPAPAPADSGVRHGVSLGHGEGVVVTAEMRDGILTVTELRRFSAGLAPIAAAVRSLLDSDPGCHVVLDRGLRGRELVDQIGEVRPRRRLVLFDARAEDRRYEVGGRLAQAIEARSVRIASGLAEVIALRKAISEASREDAADRPVLVALSLAVIDRRPPVPRIL